MTDKSGSASGERRGGHYRLAIGAGLLVGSGLLLVRATGPWPGDAVVWPAGVAAVGAFLIWRAPTTEPHRRRGWAAHSQPRLRERSSSVAAVRRPEVSRGGLGVALVLAAGIAFLWANGAIRPAGEAVLAGLAVLVALALIFAPSWRRLAGNLAAEKAERIRSQERADVGAHLHDSVLQTLTMIQQSAEDPRRVTALARRQERELRAWLTDGQSTNSGDRLAAAIEEAASEVEETAGVPVEVIAVGDQALDERAAPVLAATREAMLNAAKFGGGEPVSVYAEVLGGSVRVFVRDHGAGFDPAGVPAERRGVRESIIGRMRRAGGRAVVRSTPGGGTEVEISIEGGGP
ncbi:MAG: ATP-binding protein [Solirubrobacterales bacterium]